MAMPESSYEVDPEDPNALTLKQVHDWLQDRLANHKTIDVTDESVSTTSVEPKLLSCSFISCGWASKSCGPELNEW